MKLRLVKQNEAKLAMEIIDGAKRHLREQGIDQWQTGYPDYACICSDIEKGKGFFIVDNDVVLGYLCIDYDGEPAYDHLDGQWSTEGKYVVVHRMAFTEAARGKGVSASVVRLVEEMSRQKGVYAFRVDTDADNQKMQHILAKNGFTYRGKIWFDNSEKIAFDKVITFSNLGD